MKFIMFFVVLSIYSISYDKVALVIGNENYANGSLSLPITDAREIGSFLESKGFTVFPYQNLTLSEMKAKITNMKNQVSQGGKLLFYFSGHGSQIDKENYLIPIDNSAMMDYTNLKNGSINLNYIIKEMQKSKSNLNIVMVDACRNNPFVTNNSKGIFLSKGSKGLYPVSKDKLGKTFLVFAGAEKDTIPDDGLFRKMFIKYANQPLSLGDIFTKIRNEFINKGRNGIYINDRTREIFKFSKKGSDVQDTDLVKCNQGYAKSCTDYGAKYYMGWGVDKDYHKTVKYYGKGCDLGHGRACANLGIIYSGSTKGFIPEDKYKAEQFYSKACELGYKKGCTFLSKFTNNSSSNNMRDKDLIKCNKGYSKSCTDYGAKYYMGWGVDKDYYKAMKYYRKGCALGHGRACANLGLIYGGSTNGYINENQYKAKQLYSKACDLGYKKGCRFYNNVR